MEVDKLVESDLTQEGVTIRLNARATSFDNKPPFSKAILRQYGSLAPVSFKAPGNLEDSTYYKDRDNGQVDGCRRQHDYRCPNVRGSFTESRTLNRPISRPFTPNMDRTRRTKLSSFEDSDPENA
ncbi:uncharacterized protein TrAtP1_002279 [Trichoderma atroviride]|uniref:uncharacterized protein n=1 Tax=Hypocrea atroviridis TaxID=63577 RepID=UPI003332FE0B|nr:hypothetical protein TrAtP1_002279 [Trichoderma atroviride]